MEKQDDTLNSFGRLPHGIQQEIKNLLVHDKFTQAKDLYEKWLDALSRATKEECECF